MKKLKIEFVQSNQQKMRMQQKYLEAQLEKDLKSLNHTMHKAELELKRDQMVPTSTAISRM